jgi:L-seryl-tRNA(Ser) seleniumtransferase
MVGGGSLPEESLPTQLVAIPGQGAYVTELARRLRTGDPLVVARIEGDRLLFDVRTVPSRDLSALARAIIAALAGSSR